MTQDHYKILGVSKTATPGEIRKAYLKLSLQYHPDKNPDPNAAEEFKKIAHAYKILSDPEFRQEYDAGKSTFDLGDFNPKNLFKEMFGTEDVGEAIANVMKDPELRGPVLMAVGGAVAVGGISAMLGSMQNSSTSRRRGEGESTLNRAQASLGLLGAIGGAAAFLGGLGTYAYDQITAKPENENSSETKASETR